MSLNKLAFFTPFYALTQKKSYFLVKSFEVNALCNTIEAYYIYLFDKVSNIATKTIKEEV